MVIHGRVWKWKVKVLVVQSCPTLCGPMDCSSPNSSVHGFLQARILEWRAIPFSRNLPVGSHVRHYWQNGGTAPALLIPQARTQDEGIRPCNSDLFFPLLGWVGGNIELKGILRCLLFLRGAWEGTKPSATVLREQFIKLIIDICLRTFTKECSRMST